MRNPLKIMIAPNEDGFGTSAWVSILATDLARYSQVAQVYVVVSERKWDEFHHDKYPLSEPESKIKVIIIYGNPNKMEVAKQQGAVNVVGTVERGILTYSASRDTYANTLRQEAARQFNNIEIFDDIDMVIDFGVPQLVRAASQANLGRRLNNVPEIVITTVFDHAWSMSFDRIVSGSLAWASPPAPSIGSALEDMRNDEALTGGVILFGEPICPVDYHGYWNRLSGRIRGVIPGYLGGPLRVLEYIQSAETANLRSYFEREGHCAPRAFELAKHYAKYFLGITNDRPTLFISGGGTAVWDDILKEMVDSYLKEPPNYNVVIFSPAEVKRRGIELKSVPIASGDSRMIERAVYGDKEQLIFVGRLAGETHHVLFPAFDAVLTRAGGGTVNNAIAFRVPLILVEERGMWQVEQIRQSCLRMQLALGVTLEEFTTSPRSCVEENKQLKNLSSLKQNMEQLPNHGEHWLCATLL